MSYRTPKTRAKLRALEMPVSFASIPRLKARLLPVRTSRSRKTGKSPLRSIRVVNSKMVEIIYKDNIIIDLDGMKRAHGLITRVTGRKGLNKLVVLGPNTSFNNEAQRFIVEDNQRRQQYTRAEAVVVNSIAQLMSTSFYFMYLRDNFPNQFFMELERAKSWLREPQPENNLVLNVQPVENN